MTKRALILGVGGQDGSYLADILLEKGYDVHGLHRRSSVDNLRRITHCRDRLVLHRGDMADPVSIYNCLCRARPDEIYNEADQDSVGWSHALTGYSFDITAAAVGRLLEMVKEVCPKARVFQPCTAMMFGDPAREFGTTDFFPQNEETPFNPQSPYACAKVAAYYLCRHYRQQHGLHVSVGILYNHDSPRRSEHYLLHKICKGAQRIKAKQQETLALGNLDAVVDVGYARDYMEAAHEILQLDKPDDFVIASEIGRTVEELVKMVFALVGLDPTWRISKDEEFWHPGPKAKLIGDSSKLRAYGIEPSHTSLQHLVATILKGEDK